MMGVPQYALRLDTISDTLFFIGKAAIGSNDASPVWQIIKGDSSSGVLQMQYITGSMGAFNYSWVDRLTYSYT